MIKKNQNFKAVFRKRLPLLLIQGATMILREVPKSEAERLLREKYRKRWEDDFRLPCCNIPKSWAYLTGKLWECHSCGKFFRWEKETD
jgi:hypothetical protein